MPKLVSQGKPLTSDRIREVEMRLGVILPEDYKQFLLRINGTVSGAEHKKGAYAMTVTHDQPEFTNSHGEPDAVTELWALVDAYPASDFEPNSVDVSTVVEQTNRLRKEAKLPTFLLAIGFSADEEWLLISVDPKSSSRVYGANWNFLNFELDDLTQSEALKKLDRECKAFKSFSQLISAMKPLPDGASEPVRSKSGVNLVRKIRCIQPNDFRDIEELMSPKGDLVFDEDTGITQGIAKAFNKRFKMGLKDGRVEEFNFEAVDAAYLTKDDVEIDVFDLGDGRLFCSQRLSMNPEMTLYYEHKKVHLVRLKAGGQILSVKCSGRVKPSRSSSLLAPFTLEASLALPESFFLRGKLSDIRKLLASFNGIEEENVFDETVYASDAKAPQPWKT